MTSPQPILVTGGAGYIGAHACLRLSEAGYLPVAYDDLSNGHAEAVQWGPLVEGDIRDPERLAEAFASYRPVAVMHFAAAIEVGESVRDPAKFFEINVGGAACVIRAALASGVHAFVFSSTCATYGDPQYVPIDERHPQTPINPYGRSKLLVEAMLGDMDRHTPMRFVSLRYFNAAGGDPEGRISERHEPETHAIPLILQTAAGRRAGFTIFGSDYATRDGTAERDYVHVLDLADAHVLALRYLLEGGGSAAFNLGTGQGVTVRELIDRVGAVTGLDVPVIQGERRAGDAEILVAEPTLARERLGWRPRYGLDDMIAHAWRGLS